MTNQKILITGAGGYLAAAILRLLKDRCSHIVRVGRRKERFPPVAGTSRITDLAGDIRSRTLWESALEGTDIVFHLAAQTSVALAEEDPWDDLQVNVAPMLHLLETCRHRRWNPTVLFAGTVTVAGLPQTLPVDESHPENPITVYDLHKLMAEKYLKYYAGRGFVRGAILRLANVYGPGPRSSSADRGVMNQMIWKAVRGEPLTVFGTGKQIRDYVYVDDVARAFAAATQNIENINGRHFVIGSGRGCSILEAAALIADRVRLKTGRQPEVRRIEPPQRPSEIDARNFVADTRSFSGATGWTPQVPLTDGVDRTIQYCLEGSEGS
jgi:UDP-glucose 4-epimerase